MGDYIITYKSEQFLSIKDAALKLLAEERVDAISEIVEQYKDEISDAGATVSISVQAPGHITVDLLRFPESLADRLQKSLSDNGLL